MPCIISQLLRLVERRRTDGRLKNGVRLTHCRAFWLQSFLHVRRSDKIFRCARPPPSPSRRRVSGFNYAIRNIVAEAKKVEAAGRKVRYLNIGDPITFGFETPPHMIEAVRARDARRPQRLRPVGGDPPGARSGRRGTDPSGHADVAPIAWSSPRAHRRASSWR